MFAVLWFILAWRTPTSTHHFAPFVVAAAWGFLNASDRRSTSWIAAGAGTGVAVFTTVALLVTDRLQGPTLFDSRPSWPELLVLSALGGLLSAWRGYRKGQVDRPEPSYTTGSSR